MTFNDIFKSSFLEKAVEFSVVDVLIAMFFAVAVGLFIFLVYKKTYSSVMYSKGFASTLVGITMITTAIILTITSNVILSLGMVGALSIVRFRTAIKDPNEIVFLFWALASGIMIGAGLIPLAVISSSIIGMVIYVFAKKKNVDTTYILVLNCNNDDVEKAAFSIIQDSTEKNIVKSKLVTKDSIELTVEICIKDMKTEFVNKLSNIKGVDKAMLVSYNGEYM